MSTALVVVATGLVVLTAQRAWSIRDAERTDDDRTAALVAAREEVGALVSISAETSDDDIDRLLAGATETFREDFASQAESFRQQVVDGDVVSTGEITSAGLVSLTDESAVVLVAASGTVANDRTSEPEPRYYRLRVVLEQVDGHWLVSQLEFVA